MNFAPIFFENLLVQMIMRTPKVCHIEWKKKIKISSYAGQKSFFYGMYFILHNLIFAVSFFFQQYYIISENVFLFGANFLKK